MLSITKTCTGTNLALSVKAARVLALAELLLSFHCRYQRSGSLYAAREGTGTSFSTWKQG